MIKKGNVDCEVYKDWKGPPLKGKSQRSGKFMKFVDPTELTEFIRWTRRRQGWFLENLNLKRLGNMMVAVTQVVSKREKILSWPVAVKIDITPLCNLKCTVCVHAHPNGNKTLEKQKFHAGQKMPLAQYRRIIDEIKGKASAVSLYYLGDPFMHPDLDEMCSIARDADFTVHLSTNFSFSLTDDRIRQIVKSGVTHLTVCVDGLSQEKYQLTRVGGRIDWVLSNVKRVCQYRSQYGQVYPKIEIQYIKYQHNMDELEDMQRVFKEMGVEQVTSFWGSLHNYIDWNPENYAIHGPKKNKRIPQCLWPFFSMVIKYDGDVVPCCAYRLGRVYTGEDDHLVLGNVFKSSVREVWNSPEYHKLRRMVSNPEVISSEPSLKETFCYGCPLIFDTEAYKNQRLGSQYTFEQLYTIGEKGIPIRRQE